MSDQIEEKNEDVINMVQVLEDEELLQEDANAVLGASDAVQCTYSKVLSCRIFDKYNGTKFAYIPLTLNQIL
jgi:hypothetical protein